MYWTVGSDGGLAMDKTKKSKAGFTLMEAVIALGIWMLLFVSVFSIWHHASARQEGLLARQSDFENVRGAMDILLVNMQMARSIDLYVRPNDDMLRSLYLEGYYTDTWNHNRFRFYYDATLSPLAARFQQLVTGGEDGTLRGRNEVASNISAVHIWPDGGFMHVILKTSCDHQFVLEGTVDIRYKEVHVNGLLHEN